MKINTTTAAIALLTLAAPSFAETVSADCDGWTMTGTHQFNPDGMSRFFDTQATLQREVAGQWVDVEVDHDCGFVGPAPGLITMGLLWTSELETGTYRVLFVQEGYLNWWSDIDTAKAEAAFMPPSYVAERESGSFYCEGTQAPQDARTPGYWKNHAEAWGQNALVLGDAGSSFSQDCLLELLSVPTRGDARVKLAHHLIAAKLNLIAGSDASVVTNVPFDGDTIEDTIEFADSFLIADEIACDGFTGAKPKGLDKDVATGLKDALDAYNNNQL